MLDQISTPNTSKSLGLVFTALVSIIPFLGTSALAEKVSSSNRGSEKQQICVDKGGNFYKKQTQMVYSPIFSGEITTTSQLTEKEMKIREIQRLQTQLLQISNGGVPICLPNPISELQIVNLTLLR